MGKQVWKDILGWGIFIARNSTFTYKRKPVKVQQVAEELGVRYVLEGSVSRDAERVRVWFQTFAVKNAAFDKLKGQIHGLVFTLLSWDFKLISSHTNIQL